MCFLGARAVRLSRAFAAQLGDGGVIALVLSTSVYEPIPGLGISNAELLGLQREQRHVQRRPRLGRAQVGAEDPLNPVQPLVERGPGQVGVLRRCRLVTAGGQVGAQHADEVSVLFAGEQGTEFALHEGLQPRVVTEQMEQTTQPQVRQPVEQRLARPRRPAPGLRQSTAGLRQSTAGLRQSTAGLRQSTAGLRQSTAGLRQSTPGL